MMIFDFEVYPNWHHVTFLNEGGEMIQFNSPIDRKSLIDVIKHQTLVGFNNRNYDNLILSAVLTGFSVDEVYHLSTELITSDQPSWQIRKSYGLDDLTKNTALDFVDLQPLVAGFIGLKLLGARMHHPKLQELPFDPSLPLDGVQQNIVAEYCKNDCRITKKLYDKLKDQLALRADMSAKYKVDLRSSGDAGIAEKVLLAEYSKATGTTASKVKKSIVKREAYQYKAPAFIQPTTPQVHQLMADMEASDYKVSASGHPELPEVLKNRIISIGDKSFKIGLGGLHSIDCSGMFEADDDYLIVDVDVTSYYPAIIILTGWHPPHMTSAFNTTFKSLVDRRIAAKNAGNVADAYSLKIVVNSTFGKTGDKYSALYSPNLVIGITLTGQLALLTLIEGMSSVGLDVISANTDGVTVRLRKGYEKLLMRVCANWEKITGFNLERSDYRLLSQRDVNSYIAITTDDAVKAKGALAVHADLTHNPAGDIIQVAVSEYLKSGKSIESTILGSTNLTDFLFVRKVTGGATKDDEPLGSVVRWYYSTGTTTPILYVKSGNKVPKSDGAMPVQDLPDCFPGDIDYSIYIDQAKEILADISSPKKSGMNRTAEALKVIGYSPAPIDHKGKTLYSDDFSACAEIGTQTGERCGLIRVDGTFYIHAELGWPGAYTAASKKLGFPVQFGGVVSIGDQTEIEQLPDGLKRQLFNVLTKTQKAKLRSENPTIYQVDAIDDGGCGFE